MDLQTRVQVVLGEAERTDGLLRFILEGEGFDIIGLASDDSELARVLRGARPEVIVLDGGISATAAFEAKQASPRSSLVVVWPDGVSAVLAEERVDPHLVISDLGEAVRRAGRRAKLREPRVPMPELLRIATTARPVPAPVRKASVRNTPPKPVRTARRGSRLLVAAATWMLVITALATIAVAVPRAFDASPGERAPRPSPSERVPDHSPSETVNQGPDERTEAPEQTGGTGQPATCDAPGGAGNGTDRSRGRADADPARTQGCRRDRKSNEGSKSQGPLPPDDPGSQTDTGRGDNGVTPVEAPGGGQLDEVLGSLPTGSPPATVVPAPGADVISISPSSAASLSAMPWSPLP
jgi:hypothetical protein